MGLQQIDHDLDELDNISRVSVQTPKTVVSRKVKDWILIYQTQQSYAPSVASKKSGYSVGRSSIRTTTTTKEKLAVLQVQLEEEKVKRYEAEK